MGLYAKFNLVELSNVVTELMVKVVNNRLAAAAVLKEAGGAVSKARITLLELEQRQAEIKARHDAIEAGRLKALAPPPPTHPAKFPARRVPWHTRTRARSLTDCCHASR